jgi:hypothetical protein
MQGQAPPGTGLIAAQFPLVDKQVEKGCKRFQDKALHPKNE